MSEDVRSELTQFGFNFGAMEVTRASSFPDGSVCVIVRSGGTGLDIYASPTGRSLRVFRKGEELKPSEELAS